MARVRVFHSRNVRIPSRRKRVASYFKWTVFFAVVAGLFLVVQSVSTYLRHLTVESVMIHGETSVFNAKWLREKTGIHEGQPIFSVDLEEAVRVLEKEDWIDRVKVTRRFPHTLIFQLLRHEPKAILALDKLYYLDTNGKIFKEVGPKDAKDFPFLSGFTREAIEADPNLFRQKIQESFSLIDLYRKQEIFKLFQLSEIHYDRVSGFELYPEKSGFRVILGVGDFEAKLKRLDQALEKLKESGASFASIDLNYDGRVILTEKKI